MSIFRIIKITFENGGSYTNADYNIFNGVLKLRSSDVSFSASNSPDGVSGNLWVRNILDQGVSNVVTDLSEGGGYNPYLDYSFSILNASQSLVSMVEDMADNDVYFRGADVTAWEHDGTNYEEVFTGKILEAHDFNFKIDITCESKASANNNTLPQVRIGNLGTLQIEPVLETNYVELVSGRDDTACYSGDATLYYNQGLLYKDVSFSTSIIGNYVSDDSGVGGPVESETFGTNNLDFIGGGWGNVGVYSAWNSSNASVLTVSTTDLVYKVSGSDIDNYNLENLGRGTITSADGEVKYSALMNSPFGDVSTVYEPNSIEIESYSLSSSDYFLRNRTDTDTGLETGVNFKTSDNPYDLSNEGFHLGYISRVAATPCDLTIRFKLTFDEDFVFDGKNIRYSFTIGQDDVELNFNSADFFQANTNAESLAGKITLAVCDGKNTENYVTFNGTNPIDSSTIQMQKVGIQNCYQLETFGGVVWPNGSSSTIDDKSDYISYINNEIANNLTDVSFASYEKRLYEDKNVLYFDLDIGLDVGLGGTTNYSPLYISDVWIQGRENAPPITDLYGEIDDSLVTPTYAIPIVRHLLKTYGGFEDTDFVTGINTGASDYMGYNFDYNGAPINDVLEDFCKQTPYKFFTNREGKLDFIEWADLAGLGSYTFSKAYTDSNVKGITMQEFDRTTIRNNNRFEYNYNRNTDEYESYIQLNLTPSTFSFSACVDTNDVPLINSPTYQGIIEEIWNTAKISVATYGVTNGEVFQMPDFKPTNTSASSYTEKMLAFMTNHINAYGFKHNIFSFSETRDSFRSTPVDVGDFVTYKFLMQTADVAKQGIVTSVSNAKEGVNIQVTSFSEGLAIDAIDGQPASGDYIDGQPTTSNYIDGDF